MAQDYWWVTRPKRKLNTIPEELAAFCTVAVGKKWNHNRDSIEIHILHLKKSWKVLEQRG